MSCTLIKPSFDDEIINERTKYTGEDDNDCPDNLIFDIMTKHMDKHDNPKDKHPEEK